jgi:hypothetical protein
MKKLAAGIFLSVFVAISNGQELNFKWVESKKPVKCANTINLFSALKSEFGEKITWFSENDLSEGSTNTTIAIFENKELRTWTLVEFNTTVSCVLGSGEFKK